MKSKITGRETFLIIFFSLQLVGIAVGRYTNEKYFCWAPYDEISIYELSTTIDGQPLNNDEIFQRYRKPKTGRENRSIHNLISIVRQYETTYGKHDEADVELSYVTNGHKKATWTWPEDKIIAKK